MWWDDGNVTDGSNNKVEVCGMSHTWDSYTCIGNLQHHEIAIDYNDNV